jgi:hypothetical protein
LPFGFYLLLAVAGFSWGLRPPTTSVRFDAGQRGIDSLDEALGADFLVVGLFEVF